MYKRQIFNLAATPAALLAIGSGTALFLRESIFDAWPVSYTHLVQIETDYVGIEL